MREIPRAISPRCANEIELIWTLLSLFVTYLLDTPVCLKIDVHVVELRSREKKSEQIRQGFDFVTWTYILFFKIV